ncbi:hypothetical protein [Actinomadura sp. 3N508]|uniref:hypothetical protein n=1 Tax=Actinomadura sp. 3N508 TaxID=3375153 RepID=UPI0037BBC5DB
MDEDTLTIPASWRRRLHPRRGRTSSATATDRPTMALPASDRNRGGGADIGAEAVHDAAGLAA